MKKHSVPVYWTLYNETLGISLMESPQRTRELLHAPFSYVRVCPTCGDVWSTVKVMEEGTKYIPISRECPKCGLGLLGTFDEGYPMPRAAMIHDIKMCREPASYMVFLTTGGN